MRIIAFGGPKGSGKDTAARYLFARNSLLNRQLFIQMNFADTLKLACENLFGLTQAELNDPNLKEVVIDRWPNRSPRDLMQTLADQCRTLYAQDIFVKRWKARVLQLGTTNCIVVTDLRHPEELEELEALGAKIFYIHNPKVEEERATGIAAGDPLWSNSSEAFADLVRKSATAVIENDGVSIQNLYDNVHQAITNTMSDWSEWDQLTKSIQGKI